MTRPAALRTSALVAVVVLLVSALLAWMAAQVNARANRELLDRQLDQVATVLTNAVAVREVQLADAAQVAVAADADPAAFTAFAAERLTGTGAFVSLSLLRVQDGSVQLLAGEGSEPELPEGGLEADFFTGLTPAGQLSVAGILPGDPPRLGYALMPAGDSGLVVYAEQVIRPDRRTQVPADAAFGALDLAVYLGPGRATDQLLLATAPVPVDGGTEAASLPFGDTSITVVGASRTQLTGALASRLPAIVLGTGAVLALLGGLTVHTLSRRRALAERLAEENGRLYLEQRGIAGTLQHALLPTVPELDGIEVAARYEAGVDELEVGGDWYDVVPRGERGCVFVVGDISGRGLPAATTMAALRFAVRAHLAEGDPVETVVRKLHGLIDVSDGHQFATVLIGELDPDTGTLRLVNAGHPPPLLVTGGVARYLDGPVGPPVGVGTDARPEASVHDVPARATLLAFTDGLFERRSEVIDAGLDRLRDVVAGTDGGPVERVLDETMAAMAHDGGRDDTVLLALRWGG